MSVQGTAEYKIKMALLSNYSKLIIILFLYTGKLSYIN